MVKTTTFKAKLFKVFILKLNLEFTTSFSTNVEPCKKWFKDRDLNFNAKAFNPVN